ncbi:MAG TPA: hypothetical protein VGS10_23775 [Terracidiphilus sp.]|nr:hypothetical protein [Terracidiphilus sp.]
MAVCDSSGRDFRVQKTDESSQLGNANERSYPTQASVSLPNIFFLEPDFPHVGQIFFLAVFGPDCEMYVMANLVKENLGQFRLAKPVRALQPSASPTIQSVVDEDFDPRPAFLRGRVIHPPGLLKPDLAAA